MVEIFENHRNKRAQSLLVKMVGVIHKGEDAYKRGKGVINAFQQQCMDFVVIALFLGKSFIVIISNQIPAWCCLRKCCLSKKLVTFYFSLVNLKES